MDGPPGEKGAQVVRGDVDEAFAGGGGAADLSSGSGAQVIPDYGGGGGAQSTGAQYSTWGGAGRVLILLYRI